jgi:excinuclease ABC subunit C
MIDKKQIEELPSTFGVYLFQQKNQIIYIGKSVNIKARVKSHLENAKIDRKESLIISQADKIDYFPCQNEFEALLLESRLIKKYQPKYNVIWKDDKSYLYININLNDRYPKVFLSRKPKKEITADKKNLFFGPFSSVKIAQLIIRDLRHITPFCTEKRLSKKPCFYSKIGLCHPCPNYIETVKDEDLKNQLTKEYQKNIKTFIKILKGDYLKIIKNLSKELKKLIKDEDFEKAIIIRNKILRFEKLLYQNNFELVENQQKNDFKNQLEEFFIFIKNFFPQIKKLGRIEVYDISNLGMDYQTASMVVLTDGFVDKKSYRRFRIKNQKLTSDFDRLKEVINRRFKNNWSFPDLIIVDGGIPQLKVFEKQLNELKINCPVIGLAKNPDRLVIKKDNQYQTFNLTSEKFSLLLKLIRDESHRFAKKYHLHLRSKNFLI